MYNHNIKPAFNNQEFFIGLDVHKKTWSVVIRSSRIELKKFTMDPKPLELYNYLKKHYPGGKYYSVYEAGFCGYWIHRELVRLGIENKIVTPSEIPTTVSERLEKNDPRDARKLAKQLEQGALDALYVPSIQQQEIRSFSRLRYQLMKKQTRIKNQIKGYLHFYGHKIPENHVIQHWSGNFIEHLRTLKFDYSPGKAQLNIYLDELTEIRKRLAKVIKLLKGYCTEYEIEKEIKLLKSVPGIGFISAVTIHSELINIERFGNFDSLVRYVGLMPLISASGDRKTVMGIKKQRNSYIRELLIEAAWISIRKDNALLLSYQNLLIRMSKQEAIIRIAKKLLSRINYVLKQKKEYVYSVVQ